MSSHSFEVRKLRFGTTHTAQNIQRKFLKFCLGAESQGPRASTQYYGLKVIFAFDIKMTLLKIEFDMGSVSLEKLIQSHGV